MKKGKKKFSAFLVFLLFCFATSLVPVHAATDLYGHWAKATIDKWVKAGYINGYPDNTFRPDVAISRAELVTLLNRFFEYDTRGDISFYDVDNSDWSYEEIQKGVRAGYIQGDGNGYFRPGDTISRQEAAVMIARAKGYSEYEAGANKYKDKNNIPSWSKGYIGAVSQVYIMRGYPDASFKPYNNMTRAEAVIALDKALFAETGNNGNPETDDIVQDMTLTQNTLTDTLVKGDLTIPSSMSKQNITLRNVRVQGELVVRGGSTITAKNCDIKNLSLHKDGVIFENDGTVGTVYFYKDGKLKGTGYKKVVLAEKNLNTVSIDAEAATVQLDTEMTVKFLADADIDTFEATKNADSSEVVFTKGAVVSAMDIYDKIKITGKGDIDTMTVYVSGVRSSIKPEELKQRNGASKPTYTSTSGGGSSGGSSSSYDDLTISKGNLDFNGSGDKYDDVKITRSGANVRNLIVMGDLVIDRAVGDGTVTLTDVEVRGKTYIYGGGDHSVIFKNCDFTGDILSDVSNKDVSSAYKKLPVAVKFDNNCRVEGAVRIQGNTRLTNYSSSRVITLPKVIVESELSRDFLLELNASEVIINRKTRMIIANGNKAASVTVGDTAAGSKITFSDNASADNIYARGNTELAGTGNVLNIFAYKPVQVGSGVKYANMSNPDEVKVTGIELSQNNLELLEGQTATLTVKVLPENASNKTVTWASNDENVVKIDGKTGLVTAVREGTASITVVTQDGQKTAVCNVLVKSKEPVVIDKSPIETAIQTAEKALTAYETASKAEEVKEGVFWVTKESKDKLAAAVQTAKKELQTVNTDDAVVASAKKLNAAVDSFHRSKQAGTKKEPAKPVKKEPLETAIQTAESALTAYETAGKAEEVKEGVFWVTKENRDKLAAAIEIAKKELQTVNTDDAVTFSAKKLNDAVDRFHQSKQAGTKKETAKKEQLQAVIIEAYQIKETLRVSVNGLEISPSEYWITKEDMALFESAIQEAEGMAKLESVLQEMVDKQTEALKNTTEEIVSKREKGLLTKERQDLIEAIEVAEKELLKSGQANPEEVAAFQRAIYDAKLICENAGADTSSLQEAYRRLQEAANLFYAARDKMPVDKKQLQTALEVAVNKLEQYAVSETGNEIDSTVKWVTQAEKDIFAEVVQRAQELYHNDTVTQQQVEDAVAELTQAGTEFDSAAEAGLKISVQEITLPLESMQTTLTVGDSIPFPGVIFKPESASNQTVTWVSSNENIVSIDAEKGVFTGISAGSAILTATAQDGGKKAQFTMIVTEAVVLPPEPTVPVNPPETPVEPQLPGEVPEPSAQPPTVTEDGTLLPQPIEGQDTVPSGEQTPSNGQAGQPQQVKSNASLLITPSIGTRTEAAGIDSWKINKINRKFYLYVTKVKDNKPVLSGLTFTSSNPQVISVTNTGEAVMKGLGTAVITVTAVQETGQPALIGSVTIQVTDI